MKTAVVTGGSRGIGRAISLELASAGARIVLTCRGDLARAQATAEEIRRLGGQAIALAADVRSAEEVKALAERVDRECGGADILVNNAGIATSAPLKAITLETWNRVFAVNATGTFLCTQALLPGMVERGWGRVVNVASIAGRTAAPYIAAYAASKHAVIGFTRAVAAEVAASGVTVNAVCPGYVDTAMTDQSVARIAAKTGVPAAEARERILGTSPQHRLMEPEEVAFLVLTLCDPRARGVNGQAVVLDGGALLA